MLPQSIVAQALGSSIWLCRQTEIRGLFVRRAELCFGIIFIILINDANQWNVKQQVIITSFLFPSGKFSLERLESVLAALGGDKSKLVLDLSCRRKDNTWFVAMDRWQTITEMEINQGTMTSPSDRPFKLTLYRIHRPSGALLFRILDSCC